MAERQRVVHRVDEYLFDFGSAASRCVHDEDRRDEMGQKALDQVNALRRELLDVKQAMRTQPRNRGTIIADKSPMVSRRRVATMLPPQNSPDSGRRTGHDRDVVGEDTTSEESHVIAKGWMVKKGRKVRNWKRRYFVLNEATLYYYKSDNWKKEQPLGDLNVETCVVDELKERDSSARPCMALIVEGRKLMFHAETPEENEFWYLRLVAKQAELSYLRKVRMTDPNAEPHVETTAFLRNPHVPVLRIEGSPVPLDAVVAMSSVFRAHSTLVEINLSYAELSDLEVQSLCSGLRADNKIENLVLEGNEIGKDGCVALANLIQCGTLKFLNLGQNQAGDKGAAALAVGIPHGNLNTLQLESNSIGPNGAQALVEAAAQAYTLQGLMMNANQIGDFGAKCVASVLTGTIHLKYLHLQNNEITDKGGLQIADALEGNSSVEEVYLGGNDFSLAVTKRFTKMLLENRSIVAADIGRYQLTNTELSAIRLLADCDMLKN